jgi:type VI secretion system protein ImpM
MSGPTLTDVSTADPGFFGKLPGQGDFVTRRLPSEFLRVWDPWLQTSLTESREALGDGWLDAYLTSPIWQFVLTGAIAGQTPWAGLLMPSVDRVGRYFPLTVARALPESTNPFHLLSSAADWFAQTQTVMLAALEGGLTLDEMDARLLGTGPLTAPIAAAPAVETTTACEVQGWRLSLRTPARVPELLPGLLHHALGEIFFAYSLWWSDGSDRLPPSLLVCQGLPADGAFTALYTGDWSGGQWCDLGSTGD